MKPKSSRKSAQSLPEIFNEVKNTVSVYLSSDGLDSLKSSPFVRQEGYIAAREMYDVDDPIYLHLNVRYYLNDSTIPRHTYLAIPHRHVSYMTAEKPIHEKKSLRQLRPFDGLTKTTN